jgi:hypothetical protein
MLGIGVILAAKAYSVIMVSVIRVGQSVNIYH